MTAENAPPRLPHVFITDETDPLSPPPISRQMAQETATVSSNPPSAKVRHASAVTGLFARTPGSSPIAAARKPQIETVSRPRRRSRNFADNLSDKTPPATLVTVAARRGMLAR